MKDYTTHNVFAECALNSFPYKEKRNFWSLIILLDTPLLLNVGIHFFIQLKTNFFVFCVICVTFTNLKKNDWQYNILIVLVSYKDLKAV